MEGDRWKKMRIVGRDGIHHNGNDDEWDGSESEREREQAENPLKKCLVLG